MFFDYIIIKCNYDMYMLRNRTLAARRWRREESSALNAFVIRLPRLYVGTQEHMDTLETPKRTRDLGSA